jgi:hypothetical protein
VGLCLTPLQFSGHEVQQPQVALTLLLLPQQELHVSLLLLWLLLLLLWAAVMVLHSILLLLLHTLGCLPLPGLLLLLLLQQPTLPPHLQQHQLPPQRCQKL